MADIVVEFERISKDGLAVGVHDGREVFAYGALPGEKAVVEILRRPGARRIARVKEVLVASPARVPACEAHYLSCSPWQVIDYRAQVAFKRQMLEAMFAGITGQQLTAERFYESEQAFGYRNKLEFSFAQVNGRLRLAFFERGSPFRKVALDEGCLLGTTLMNEAALEILGLLAARGVDARQLKSLTVRESGTTQGVIAVLYVKDRQAAPLGLAPGRCAGFVVAWSDPRSPASLVSEVLETRGHDTLEERLLDLTVEYPFNGFFQNHVELFRKALEEIREFMPECEKAAELYCGTGAIGLAVRDRVKRLIAVESDPPSARFAQRNVERNRASNIEICEGRVEQLAPEIFAGADVLLLDPPRSGLHPKLIHKIVEAQPERIVYLACNPANQARDFGLLREHYRPVALLGFDFYPQTPHVESLLVLDRLPR